MDITQAPQSIDREDSSQGSTSLIEKAEEYLASGNFNSACSCLKEALLAGVEEVEIYNRLGFVNYCQQDYHVALECFNMALDISRNDPEVLINLGLLNIAISQFNDAEQCFLEAAEDPKTNAKANLNLAKLSLAFQRYDIGWDYYRFRPNNYHTDIALPNELEGKQVLVYGGANLWDELFFLRFLPTIVNSKASISYYSNNEVCSLLARNIDHMEILQSLPKESEFDLTLPLEELPRLLNASPQKYSETIYFRPQNSSLEIVKNLLPNNGRPNIAVVWETTNNESNGVRSRISPDLIGESLRYSEANVLVLQNQPSMRDIRLLEKGLRRKVFNYGFVNDSLENCLAFIAEVDHLISVGDINIHFAASLKTDVSLMVSHPPRWQWLLEGDKSPWFPGFNLYRQDASGDWEHACHELKSSLLC